MTGGGFSDAGRRFLEDLEDDNSREFFTARRDVFEREVREPMAALLESLPAAYQPFRVFRMNRDVRFSNDKSPYKTQHGAIHPEGGTDHYVHLDARGLMAGMGIYWMEPDQLGRYRAAVADGRLGSGLQRTLDSLTGEGMAVNDIGLEPLKTAPRGYTRDHPRIDLLRLKGVVAHRTLTGSDLTDGDAVRAFVVETFERGEPLVRWLRRHVGSSPTHP